MLFYLLCGCLSFIQTGNAFRINLNKSNTPMLDMLDMMQQLMTGGTQFDRNFIKEVRTCMASFDPQLPDVQDKIWQGIIDYWDMGGNPDDPWGGTGSEFVECNITVSSYKKMTIYEPCNFASNVAFYHLLTELCKRRAVGSKFHFPQRYMTATGKVIAALTPASSFLHATNTKLGEQQDVGIINIMAYLLHQGVMEALPYRSPILNDLSRVPRPMTSLQLVDAVQKMHSSEPVAKWYKIFDTLDIPDYIFAIASTTTIVFHMIFDDDTVNQIIPMMVNLLELTAEEKNFITKDFLPELRIATPHVDRKKNLRDNFLGNYLSTTAKTWHALVWNELRVIRYPIFLKPITNRIGWALLPILNNKINGASSFQYFKSHFQKGENIYPGEQWCNPKNSHAKWHVQVAVGILDMIYLGDEAHRLLTPTRS